MNVAILVGGRGGRIGGDKGLLKLCGRTFVEILIDKFQKCNIVLVCRDENQAEEYSKFGKTIIDEIRNFSPLAGIYTALMYFKDYTLIIAVDMPLVKRELAEFLFKLCIESRVDVVVPTWSDGKIEPLLACYSYDSAEKIRSFIKKGERRVYRAIKGMRALYYPIDELRKFDSYLHSFINVNTKEDYRRVLKVIGCL